MCTVNQLLKQIYTVYLNMFERTLGSYTVLAIVTFNYKPVLLTKIIAKIQDGSKSSFYHQRPEIQTHEQCLISHSFGHSSFKSAFYCYYLYCYYTVCHHGLICRCHLCRTYCSIRRTASTSQMNSVIEMMREMRLRT